MDYEKENTEFKMQYKTQLSESLTTQWKEIKLFG